MKATHFYVDRQGKRHEVTPLLRLPGRFWACETDRGATLYIFEGLLQIDTAQPA